MGEDSSHAERSSSRASSSNNPTTPEQPDTTHQLLIPSFSPSTNPPSTNTLTRLGFRSSPTSPTSPTSPGGQVSAITVVSLLDKLVNMVEVVQENQRRMERQQADLEGVVRGVQGDVIRLAKTHTATSNSVGKLLERSRKVGGHMKEVRERMDKQAVLVKRLEANHQHLLKRNHFKVLIFQEDNEIPSSVFIQDSLKSPQLSHLDAESAQPTPSVTGSAYGLHSQEEGLQTISLSSDEDNNTLGLREEEESLVGEASVGFGAAQSAERSRAEKIKRSSLKKVDSLKRAFSRQSIEKQMSKISTRIVPPERREKIKKSLTPNHPKSPSTKSSSFKVSPMTFNVKKVRDGEVTTEDMGSPEEIAHVEILPLGSLDGEHPLAEAHSQESLVGEAEEMPSPSTPKSIHTEPAINGEVTSVEDDLNGDHPASLAVPERDEVDEEGGEEKGEEEKHHKGPVEMVADAQIPTAVITVEQVS
ncbi:caveolae-associated protein 2a [Diretmus argenteus]